MLWSFLTWFFKPFGELCLALRDTKWPSTSPFGSPDTTLQHLKSPAGHCSKVCFHLGSEANLMCFKVTLHLLGGSQYMGNMLTYKMNRRTVESWNIIILFGKNSKHFFVAKLGMTWLFEMPESTMSWKKEGQPIQNSSKYSTSSESTTKHLKISLPHRLIGIPITRKSACCSRGTQGLANCKPRRTRRVPPKKGCTTERVQKITF